MKKHVTQYFRFEGVRITSVDIDRFPNDLPTHLGPEHSFTIL